MKVVLGAIGGLYASSEKASFFSIFSNASKIKVFLLKKNSFNLNMNTPVLRGYFFIFEFFLAFIEMLSFSLSVSKSIKKTSTVYFLIFGSMVVSFFVFLLAPELIFDIHQSSGQESTVSLMVRVFIFWSYMALISFHPLIREVFQFQKAKNQFLFDHKNDVRFSGISRVCEYTYFFILLTLMIFYYSFPVDVWIKLLLFFFTIPLLYEALLRFESAFYYFIYFFRFFVNKNPNQDQIEFSNKFLKITQKINISTDSQKFTNKEEVDFEEVF